ncbi:hypothetical protein KFL_000120010 [Klebsormidium nitens]|uniref:Uncharacterized protein n=1 Tax=Klebsormidium nitens TaxID=105231 RepID=A0A1Y1HK97_KLENI|nr:hypothetical protein KFL_000120010 [Klebsormidium nitens]|eukprot:GAQ78353.1 hypothetical protein KFL_000120010 [Klebsormidium nitens]
MLSKQLDAISKQLGSLAHDMGDYAQDNMLAYISDDSIFGQRGALPHAVRSAQFLVSFITGSAPSSNETRAVAAALLPAHHTFHKLVLCTGICITFEFLRAINNLGDSLGKRLIENGRKIYKVGETKSSTSGLLKAKKQGVVWGATLVWGERVLRGQVTSKHKPELDVRCYVFLPATVDVESLRRLRSQDVEVEWVSKDGATVKEQVSVVFKLGVANRLKGIIFPFE